MPILKQLVSGQPQTKRRSRMDLTTEMISAPLGDFRHTMHVGRSGDAFGDTSFLSSRSGEPPQAPNSSSSSSSSGTFPRSPKPGGLLSRTFRSSKRSQSVTRVDQRENTLLPPSGSPTFVKNALSLPFLNNEGGDGSEVGPLKSLASSLTSSPSKQRNASSNGVNVSDLDQGMDLELHERCFGELTDLRPSPSYNSNLGGIKRAESVMSFHVDLGPSMLGDILDVMEKEDDDQGFEEGKGSEGRASPLHGDRAEGEEEEGEGGEEEEVGEEDERGTQPEAPLCAPELNLEVRNEAESEPEVPKQADSCSVSSSDSHVLENRASSGQTDSAGAEDTDSAHYGYHPGEEGAFSSFMEDEDDEIRV